ADTVGLALVVERAVVAARAPRPTTVGMAGQALAVGVGPTSRVALVVVPIANVAGGTIGIYVALGLAGGIAAHAVFRAGATILVVLAMLLVVIVFAMFVLLLSSRLRESEPAAKHGNEESTQELTAAGSATGSSGNTIEVECVHDKAS